MPPTIRSTLAKLATSVLVGALCAVGLLAMGARLLSLGATRAGWTLVLLSLLVLLCAGAAVLAALAERD